MKYKNIFMFLTVSLFSFYSIWWLWLFFLVDPSSELRNYFTDTYGIIAGLGGILGLLISKKWGGFSSFVGKSLIFFSTGLLFQFLGQLSYTLEFYIYHIENSYPSIGELFYFGSIPLYILGVWYIARASGSVISLRNYKNIIGAILFPVAMVAISYFLFVQGNNYEDSSFLANVLNFAYPIGQAIFVSLAILAYYLSRKILGGVMKKRVILILFSLVFQYAADTAFLYKTIQGTWYPGDISEYLFVVSYFLMTIAFIQFLTVLEQLRKA